jgi:ABC-2 type transport system permease protein
MEAWLLQMWAFVYRDCQRSKRDWEWLLVSAFYDVIFAASLTLIGIAAHNSALTKTLITGAVYWIFLSSLFGEISLSIAVERWEGTIEHVFMAPISRTTHLLAISLSAVLFSLLRLVVVVAGLMAFTRMSVNSSYVVSVMLILLTSSVSFVGLGLIAATLPIMSPERGAEAANVIRGTLLLISGIYYPISVLPRWIRPMSRLSPATYALDACRKLIDTSYYGQGRELVSGSVIAIAPELIHLLLIGAVLLPAGLWVFMLVERQAKRTGKLHRGG